MTQLVIFDLDGTLVPLPSSERRFAAAMVREGKLGPRQVAAWLGFVARHVHLLGRDVLRTNKAYLYRLPVAQVDAHARKFVEEELLPHVRPIMRNRIAMHKRRGDTLLLMTGAPDFIAAPLARTLGMPHCIATQCARSGGRYRAALPVVYPNREEKLRLAVELADELGFALDNATAYGDSVHDLPLLSCVGTAIAVVPDARLAEHALQAGWERLG
jgi:HAD superfamily hydrolase (TIGR01490 family)